jgi:hypothetical protein
MNNLDNFAIPMTMGDWALVLESIASKIREMESIDQDSIDEDELADMYTDKQNIEGVFAYIKNEFEKNYGGLPPGIS